MGSTTGHRRCLPRKKAVLGKHRFLLLTGAKAAFPVSGENIYIGKALTGGISR